MRLIGGADVIRSRMRMGFLIVAAMALAGCDRAAEKAEEDYYFLSDSESSKAEKCAAAIKARDAWADRKDKKKYEDWAFTAKAYC